MFGPEDLAVSLPARELAKVELAGSVFSVDALDGEPISEALRFAIDLLRMATEDAGGSLRFIARPEMFTHGETVAWLRAELGSARNHVCISDASCIRVIPGFQNHVFFYGLGQKSHFEALQR